MHGPPDLPSVVHERRQRHRRVNSRALRLPGFASLEGGFRVDRMPPSIILIRRFSADAAGLPAGNKRFHWARVAMHKI
jgi:hypothetical protein